MSTISCKSRYRRPEFHIVKLWQSINVPGISWVAICVEIGLPSIHLARMQSKHWGPTNASPNSIGNALRYYIIWARSMGLLYLVTRAHREPQQRCRGQASQGRHVHPHRRSENRSVDFPGAKLEGP